MKQLLITFFFVMSILVNAQKNNTILTISDGTTFVPKDFYPNFSWDVTPQYMMFADGKRVLTADEVTRINNLSRFICIEKNHAQKELGFAELGAKHEVEAFKKQNPTIKVLYYFNSAYAWPFTSYNQYFTRKSIDEHPELKKLLLVDEKTGELHHRNNIFNFDVLNPEFRDWWVTTVVKGVVETNADGVFIDQMHGFAWLRKNKAEEVKIAMGEMMKSLKEKLGETKIVLGNNAERVPAVFPYVDATMFEHYNSNLLSKESLLNNWEDMYKIAKAGKMSVFRIGVEAVEEIEKQLKDLTQSEKMELLQEKSKELEEYFLACYLIGAEPYTFFQYGFGWRLDTGPLVDYPLLLKPIGAPKGKFTRTNPNKWEFTRSFENVDVWVDTEQKKATLTWKN